MLNRSGCKEYQQAVSCLFKLHCAMRSAHLMLACITTVRYLYCTLHTDAVVSATFLLMIALLSVTVFEALTKAEGRLMATLLHCELLAWCCPVAYFVLRYASLGSATNARSVATVISTSC
jgi:uncharacterized membrane protein